jgi:hypothetical protein
LDFKEAGGDENGFAKDRDEVIKFGGGGWLKGREGAWE